MEHIKRTKIEDWDALVFTDDNGVCISLDERGGAIIGADNYQEAEKRFIEAMRLAESIGKLLHYKEHGKFPATY